MPPVIFAGLGSDMAWFVYFHAMHSLVYNVLLFEYSS